MEGPQGEGKSGSWRQSHPQGIGQDPVGVSREWASLGSDVT